MNWKIYYGDGSTFSDLEGSPSDAPGLNVQVVGQRDDQCGRLLLSGKDYYVNIDGEWVGLDLFGVIDTLITMGVVKAGRTITNQSFREVLNRAITDKDLARKSANWPQTELNRPTL